MDKSEVHFFATQLVFGSAFQAALKSAIELDVLELIKKAGPGALLSPVDIAAQIPTTNPDAPGMLDRILRLLSAYSVLNCTLKSLPDGHVQRLYSLGPVCEFLTKNEDGVSLAPLLLLNEDQLLKRSWDKIKDAVIEGGIPFDKAYGMSAFEYAATNPSVVNLFDESMSNHSTLVMRKILETYDGFEGLKSMVDVGGGHGATLRIITSKYPSLKGINFDLPHVIQHAPPCSGVEHVGGDMFLGLPKADAIFMKSISHDWSDERCIKLFKSCHEAIPENGKVILAEIVLPEAPDNGWATKAALLFDVTMMTHSPGGKERTERELHALAKEAGFKESRKVCCAYNHWIIELIK